MGTEDALVFTTGYLANVGCLIGTLLGPGDTVDLRLRRPRLDPRRRDDVARARPAVPPQPARQARVDARARGGRRRRRARGGGRRVLDGGRHLRRCPTSSALCREHGARLMVDEAHGVGVLGARGAGACELFGVEDEVDLRMGTFSKSLASLRRLHRRARRRDRLPARPVALVHVHRVRGARRDRRGARRAARSSAPTRARSCSPRCSTTPRYLHDGLPASATRWWSRSACRTARELITPIVPVLVGDDWKAVLLWKALYDAGVYVERRDLPRRPARRRAAAHERDGDARAGAPRPRARDLRARQGRGRGGTAAGLTRSPPSAPLLHTGAVALHEVAEHRSIARHRPHRIDVTV